MLMGLIDLFRGSSSPEMEVQLLTAVLNHIPVAVSKPLLAQLNAGIIRGVRHNASDIPGCSSFKHNTNVLKVYEDESIPDYTITDIYLGKKKGPDEKLRYTIFVSSGLLSGYSILPEVSLSNVSLETIDCTNYRLVTNADNPDYLALKTVLKESELNHINPSAVYMVHVNGVDYFHVRDIDDGDFIGVGHDGALYRVTHEGPTANKLPNDIAELWKI